MIGLFVVWFAELRERPGVSTPAFPLEVNMPSDKKGTIWAAIIGLIGTVIVAALGFYQHQLDRAQIQNLQKQVQGVVGKYEWQWAGDRWRVVAQISSNQAEPFNIALEGKQKCPSAWKDFLKGDGTAYQELDGSLKLDVTAKVTSYDYDCLNSHLAQDTIRGDLFPVAALAGRIEWTENGQTQDGDMVLTKYTSRGTIW